MSYDKQGFTEEELAYLNGGGEEPSPASEANAEPAAEPQAETDEKPEGDAAPDAAAEPTDPDVEVTEEGDGEGETGEDGKAKKRRRVDYSAYLRQKNEADAARKEREELRERLNAAERERAVINDRIAQAQAAAQQRAQMEAQQRAQAGQPQPEPMPDPTEHPLEALAWQAKRIEQLEQGFNQTVEERRQQAAIRQLDDAYRMDNHQAAKELPDYPAAYNYVVKLAEETARIHNPTWTPQQIKAHVEMQERQLAASAYQQRRRPAQIIYETARIQGYQPPAAQQPAQAPAQPDPAAAQARLDDAARAQAQNLSLSGAGRPGSSSGAMTIDKFSRMPDAERAKWIEQNPEAFAALAGA